MSARYCDWCGRRIFFRGVWVSTARGGAYEVCTYNVDCVAAAVSGGATLAPNEQLAVWSDGGYSMLTQDGNVLKVRDATREEQVTL